MAIDSRPLVPHQLALALFRNPSILTWSAVMPSSSTEWALYFPLSNSRCIDLSSPSLASCIKSCSIGRRGGLASKSLSSTLSRPSLSAELVALLEGYRSSGDAEGAREDMSS